MTAGGVRAPASQPQLDQGPWRRRDAMFEKLGQEPARHDHQRHRRHPLVRGDGEPEIDGGAGHADEVFGGDVAGNQADAEVVNISVADKKTTGVELANGEKISANVVVSNLDAKRTFLKIMNEADLPPKLVHRAQHFKIRGSSGKLNIALDGMPEFPALPPGSPLTLGLFR